MHMSVYQRDQDHHPPWRGAGIDIQMVELDKKKGEYSEIELMEKSR